MAHTFLCEENAHRKLVIMEREYGWVFFSKDYPIILSWTFNLDWPDQHILVIFMLRVPSCPSLLTPLSFSHWPPAIAGIFETVRYVTSLDRRLHQLQLSALPQPRLPPYTCLPFLRLRWPPSAKVPTWSRPLAARCSREAGPRTVQLSRPASRRLLSRHSPRSLPRQSTSGVRQPSCSTIPTQNSWIMYCPVSNPASTSATRARDGGHLPPTF